MDQEMNSIVGLVEVLNFNENYPENHTFCTTALNDKYISTMNSETLMIEKIRKKDFFDSTLISGLNKMKLLYNKLGSKNNSTATKYKSMIDNLTNFVLVNNKGKKAYVELMNSLTFNKKHIAQSTWLQLKNNELPNKIKTENKAKPEDEDFIESYENFNDMFIMNDSIESSSDTDSSSICQLKNKKPINNYESSDSESEEEDEINEIKIKDKMYIVNNMKLYTKNDDGTMGTLYGTYINGKIKKMKEIVI
jgi:hypothetical protein